MEKECSHCDLSNKCSRTVFSNVFDLILHYLNFHDIDENEIMKVLDLSKKELEIQKVHINEKLPEMDYFAFFNEEQKAILEYVKNESKKSFKNYKVDKVESRRFLNTKVISNLNILNKKSALNLITYQNSRSKRMDTNLTSNKKTKQDKKKKIVKHKKESFVNTFSFFNM